MFLRRIFANGICLVLVLYSTTMCAKQRFLVNQNKKIISDGTAIKLTIASSTTVCATECMMNAACCQAHYYSDTKYCTIHSSNCMETEQYNGSYLIQKVINQGNLKPIDCSEIPACSCNGVYRINPGNSTEGFDVYCEDGWTVFQKRFDGKTSFFRNWADYKNGFGNVSGEHWLGNDKLFTLTSNKNYSVRFDLTDINDERAFAIYSTFRVEDESLKYKMTVGVYNGTAGDSFWTHSGNMFTTADNDNDMWFGGNCVTQREGGYWYNSCGWTNLNGKYTLGQSGWNLMIWEGFCMYDSLKSCVMKLK